MLKPAGCHFSSSSQNDKAQGGTHWRARMHTRTHKCIFPQDEVRNKGHLRSFHCISLAMGLEIKDEITPLGYFWWLCPLLFFTSLTFQATFFLWIYYHFKISHAPTTSVHKQSTAMLSDTVKEINLREKIQWVRNAWMIILIKIIKKYIYMSRFGALKLSQSLMNHRFLFLNHRYVSRSPVSLAAMTIYGSFNALRLCLCYALLWLHWSD